MKLLTKTLVVSGRRAKTRQFFLEPDPKDPAEAAAIEALGLTGKMGIPLTQGQAEKFYRRIKARIRALKERGQL